MSHLSRSTNWTYGVLVLLGIAAAVVLGAVDLDDGGLMALGVLVLTAGLVLAWGIQTVIDRKVAKQPSVPLGPEALARYKRNRILVIIGLIIFIFGPMLFRR